MPTSPRPEGSEATVLCVVAVGGTLGAATRYAVGLAWPTAAGGVPWGTFAINLTGCFALGALMSRMIGRGDDHPLLRPFLGTGVIGGFTTFSTYVVEVDQLLLARHPALGLGYLGLSVMFGLIAVILGRAVEVAVRGARAASGAPR